MLHEPHNSALRLPVKQGMLGAARAADGSGDAAPAGLDVAHGAAGRSRAPSRLALVVRGETCTCG